MGGAPAAPTVVMIVGVIFVGVIIAGVMIAGVIIAAAPWACPVNQENMSIGACASAEGGSVHSAAACTAGGSANAECAAARAGGLPSLPDDDVLLRVAARAGESGSGEAAAGAALERGASERVMAAS